jgi:hypothetical protein
VTSNGIGALDHSWWRLAYSEVHSCLTPQRQLKANLKRTISNLVNRSHVGGHCEYTRKTAAISKICSTLLIPQPISRSVSSFGGCCYWSDIFGTWVGTPVPFVFVGQNERCAPRGNRLVLKIDIDISIGICPCDFFTRSLPASLSHLCHLPFYRSA